MSIKINYPNDVIETFYFDSREDEAAAIEEVLKRVGPDSEVVILKTIVSAEKTKDVEKIRENIKSDGDEVWISSAENFAKKRNPGLRMEAIGGVNATITTLVV